MLPVALIYGVPTVEAFWALTFRQFEAYQTAHEAKVKEIDRINWLNGMYTLSAVKTVVGQALGDKTASYFYNPLTDETEKELDSLDAEFLENPESITPEERKRRTQELFDELAISRANMQLNNLRKKLEKEKEEKKHG